MPEGEHRLLREAGQVALPGDVVPGVLAAAAAILAATLAAAASVAPAAASVAPAAPPPWHDPFFDLQDRPPSPPPRTAPRPSSLLARPFALPPPPPPLDERYDGEAQSVDQLRADLRALRGLRPLEGLAIAILALLVLGAVAALVLARLPRRAARRGSPEESAELARA